jgi:nitrogen fixation NifU-like protein
VATANIFCTSIHGQTIASIIKRSSSEIAQMLGELEPSQYHCLDILHELHQQLEQNATEKEVKSWQAQ